MYRVDTGELQSVAVAITGSPRQVIRRVEQATRKAALDVTADARQTAPYRTGFLRSSIGHTMHHDGGVTAEVGPTAHYGAYLEYGTSRMTPRPYMAPAFDRHTPGWVTAIGQAAQEIL